MKVNTSPTVKTTGVGRGSNSGARSWSCVTGAALDLAGAAGVDRWHLSLTHSDTTAGAYVVAESTDR